MIARFKTSQPCENMTNELKSLQEMLLEENTNPVSTNKDDADTGNTDRVIEMEICIDVD